MRSSFFEMINKLEDTSCSYKQELFESGELFSTLPSTENLFLSNYLQRIEKRDLNFISNYFSLNFDASVLEGTAQTLYELSVNAFDIILHAWMSEMPIEEEITAFVRKVLNAATCTLEEKRHAAELAAADRGDANTLVVLKAAGKVYFEVHRMSGLLRFFPVGGEYIARCAPDHFILPCLGEYFTERFGDTTWTIIDEKRGLFLRRPYGEKFKLVQEIAFTANSGAYSNTSGAYSEASDKDEWVDLWQHYHKTINNEDRSNPNLQRQLMPSRYWKYLPEINTQ